ncbi:MAG: hypothetical protein ABFC89_11195 [Methanospirillum sp.]
MPAVRHDGDGRIYFADVVRHFNHLWASTLNPPHLSTPEAVGIGRSSPPVAA